MTENGTERAAKEVRVASGTDSKGLSWTIRKLLDEGHRIHLSAIGAMAVNVACRAVAITNGDLAVMGKELLMRPFFDLSAEGPTQGPTQHGELTVMKLALTVQVR